MVFVLVGVQGPRILGVNLQLNSFIAYNYARALNLKNLGNTTTKKVNHKFFILQTYKIKQRDPITPPTCLGESYLYIGQAIVGPKNSV